MSDGDKPCPNVEANKGRCSCAHSSCARHGFCCKCVQYHLSKRELPQCYVKAGVR